MLDRYSSICSLIFIIFFTACGTSDISRSFGADQANRLLSNGDEKVWSLIATQSNGEDNFGPCTEDNSITFVNATQKFLYVLGRPVTCGSTVSVDTLYKANYEWDENNEESIYKLILSEEKFNTIGSITIHSLTSSQLQLSYLVNEIEYIDSYQY